MPLISVEGDLNKDDGAGALIATQHTVLINNKAIIVINDPAEPDSNNDEDPANTGSSSVFVNNKAVHRQDDLRLDGDKTIVIGQTTVYAG
jgi:uncharacterized Zn-binding protein involved in type VI secretion